MLGHSLRAIDVSSMDRQSSTSSFGAVYHLPRDLLQSRQLCRVLLERSAHVVSLILGIHENAARDLQTEHGIEGAHHESHHAHHGQTHVLLLGRPPTNFLKEFDFCLTLSCRLVSAPRI